MDQQTEPGERGIHMATKTRGKVLSQYQARARGPCPACGRTGVKLLHNGLLADGTSILVCKFCRTKKALNAINVNQ